MKLVGTMLLGGMTRAELYAPALTTSDAQAASETTAARASGVRLADQIRPEPELKALIAAV